MSRTKLTDVNEILLRQINPIHIRNDIVYEGAFKPRGDDLDQLSVNTEKLIQPDAAHLHFTTVKNSQSRAVGRLTVGEALGQSMDSYLHPNPPAEADFDKSHSEIDFSTATSKTKCSKALAAHATKRGFLYYETPQKPPIATSATVDEQSL